MKLCTHELSAQRRGFLPPTLRAAKPIIAPAAAPRKRRSCCRAASNAATVIQNAPCTLDESARLLRLSVNDPIEYLEGRRMSRKQAAPRWLDGYRIPGQTIEITYGGETFTTAIASSPYAARRESALLDASIVEVLVSTGGNGSPMMDAAPGTPLSVSDVRGVGFTSVSNSDFCLTAAMEEKRPLMLFAYGSRGIAPIRAALEWAPLQAHATDSPVTLIYACDSMPAAAFVKDWDEWRSMGVTVLPLFLHTFGSATEASDDAELQSAVQNGRTDAPVTSSLQEDGTLGTSDRFIKQLEELLFSEDKQFSALVGNRPKETAIVMSGLPVPVAAALSRFLTSHRVTRQSIMLKNFH